VRVEKLKNHVVLVFKTSDGEEIKTVLPLSHILGTLRISHIVRHRPPRLKKPDHNPIITPNPDHPWESQATFNTAALHLDGKVHFLYRAIGDTGVSVLGYASSVDGLHIDERLAEPAYVSTSDFDERRGRPIFRTPYGSGGGYGGVEDPRLILVDGRIYMTYVAFDGWRPPRVALTSIEIEDFLKHRWCWKPPVLISPPDVVDKNAVIFPERVRGKYVIFHRIFPNVLVDFVDSLDFQEGEYLKGEFVIPPREDSWDSRKLGAGAPPMKTKDGWLLIYHAVDDKDASKYKIGAMLLDLDDPRKVLHRTMSPILEPDMPYENDGYKSGVAYPCGAVILKDHLFVYYGGADTVTCVAWHPLDEFLEHLKKH